LGEEVNKSFNVDWIGNDKKRKRAIIFYKASFYDRDAFIDFEQRVRFNVNRKLFLDGDYSQSEDREYIAYKSPFVGRVFDYDGKIFLKLNKLNVMLCILITMGKSVIQKSIREFKKNRRRFKSKVFTIPRTELSKF